MLIISTLDRRMGACDDLSPQAERPFTRTVYAGVLEDALPAIMITLTDVVASE